MDDLKKKRTVKARVVTRRVTELSNGMSCDLSEDDILDKLNNLKYALSELGAIHDDVVVLVEADGPDADAVATEDAWYDAYDKKVNRATKQARLYIATKAEEAKPKKPPVRFKKLEIPKFDSDPKKFFKWRETFLRFTNEFDDVTKYDYLFSNTVGEAHTYVSNRREFNDAMKKLEEKYGNVHEIMGLMIDEIKALSPIKRGDFKAFEQLSLHVNDFHDRLVLMGRREDVENSYILKEIESKLNFEDLQKWLESQGSRVDDRRVQQLLEWLETQTRLRRIASQNSYKSQYSTAYQPGYVRRPASYCSNAAGTVIKMCPICSSEHSLESCTTFSSLPLNDRWERLKLLRACFICFQPNHRRRECTSPLCQVCSGPHHTMLHNHVNKRFFDWRNPTNYDLSAVNDRTKNVTNSTSASASSVPQRGPFPAVQTNNKSLCESKYPTNYDSGVTNEKTNNAMTSSSAVASGGPRRCFLPVVQVKLKNEGNEAMVKAALDSMSELNIITSRFCDQLQLRGKPINISIEGAGGTLRHTRSKLVKVTIEDAFGAETVVECVVLRKACGKALKINKVILENCEAVYNVDISKLVTDGGDIDFLIGYTNPELHKQLAMETMRNGLSILTTRFGQCLVGTVPEASRDNLEPGAYGVYRVSILPEPTSELETMREHLQCELAGVNADVVGVPKSEEDLQFDEKMKTAWSTDANGRFEVKLPWKINPETLENNVHQALERDVSLRKRLDKEPDVYHLFQVQITDMVTQGILKKVSSDYPRRYLPLLAVVNLDKESSKVRICLDAKCKFKGISLNDALYKGSLEMIDIFQAISRFRCGMYTMVGDIKKMFWQIKLSQEDERYHGVIWEGNTYVFTRVCYGDKPSPPIADQSMKKVAVFGKAQYPRGSEVIDKKRYVDDLLDASNDLREIKKKRDETEALLGKFGFEIKGWQSNHPDVGMVKYNCKVLGARWNAEKDVLFPTFGKGGDAQLTLSKQSVLSKIAGIWDPIGMCCGLLMRGKLIFQAMVRMKCSWDEVLDDNELVRKWTNWTSEVAKCEGLTIDRSLLSSKMSFDSSRCSLIGFSDGSSVGNGCALYLRWTEENEENIDVKFVGAKGKVNPIKGTTTPRSEMSGAFVLSRLAYSAEQAFSETELKSKIDEKILFTDSTTVLSWVQSAALKYKPFVRNKIIEMQILHPASVWKYVPSSKNTAADAISKGCSRKELDKIIRGPEFLYTPQNEWKAPPLIVNKDEVDAEKVSDIIVNPISIGLAESSPIDVSRFGSWNKLVRTTAYVFKFGLPKVEDDETALSENILAIGEKERYKAEHYWIVHAQKELVRDEKKIEKLAPFVDTEGIKRVNGRIRNSDLFDANQKHQILLPKNHKISELIVKQVHDDLHHPGASRVTAEVRRKYWILGLRSVARRTGRKCVICKRWRGMALEQFMANLPNFRLTPGMPFETTAVDYFGPFFIKFGYRQRRKAYGAIFTCLTTRAVHAELVTDLTADRFLMALRRFMSIYGRPKDIRSDNGRNFVGAANELRCMLRSWKKDNNERKAIRDFCNEHTIRWTFSTPLASHHNGCVEAMVKSVKTTLNKITKDNILSEEEYRTVLSEVTACINSRPLWPSSNDSMEQPITCLDLLRPAGLPRDPANMNVTCNMKKRYQFIQRLVNEWWRLWMTHFVPNLQPRGKWFKKRENVEIGDIVLMIDKDISRSKWNMGIIEEAYTGPDGLVRSARVRTASSTYDRPITKLTLLLSKEERIENEKFE